LTNKDKFILNDSKDEGILHWKKESNIGPSFGCRGGLVIGDKASKNLTSYFNLNTSFYNKKYANEKGETDHHKFIGTCPYNKTAAHNSFYLV
jgi:hypothetical protein